jgi:porin
MTETSGSAARGESCGKPCRSSRGVHLRALCLVAAGCGLAAAIWPAIARADCDVPNGGVPDDTMLPAAIAKLGGLRPSLATGGIAIGGSYVGEYYGNLSGGIDRTGAYDGVLDLSIDADMHKLGLWKGLCFHANGFQIHGVGITARGTGSISPVSSFEADPATRLFEMWFEQSLFDGKLSVRFGQLGADAEFAISQGGGYFLNGTWGWPNIAAADFLDGGPAYPLATPGVRVAYKPNDDLNLMVAVFNGDPSKPCAAGDPQLCNPNGFDFDLDADPLLMAEGDYSYTLAGKLPGTVKVGGWNNFGQFPDLRFDAGGNPIAVSGLPGRPIRDNYGVYGIIDQLVWREPGGGDPQGVGVFGRIMGAPSDQNLVDFYADMGLTFTGMIPGRPDDALALGFAYTGISGRAKGSDRDSGLSVLQDYESLLEVAYTWQIRQGWTLQPDFQYIWQPGGDVPDASGTQAVGNAVVIGARSVMTF